MRGGGGGGGGGSADASLIIGRADSVINSLPPLPVGEWMEDTPPVT